jgi:hypothetical protein
MFMFIRAEQPGRKLGAKYAVGLELFTLCVTRTLVWVLVMKNWVYNVAFFLERLSHYEPGCPHVTPDVLSALHRGAQILCDNICAVALNP